MLEQLKPENMIFTVVSQKFAGKKDNLHEKWYGTEYNKVQLDEVCPETCEKSAV